VDLSQEQIDREFARQVYLCSGLGEARMLALVRDHFRPRLMCHNCPHPEHAAPCLRCGCDHLTVAAT
jgi:hypothetical protein